MMKIRYGASMRRTRPFRDMASTPLDGRIVEICDGANGKIVLAYWHECLQGWVDDNDYDPWPHMLHSVIGWRPVD